MKKSIILLIISIVALCIPVQAQHLKFMDIPLTGTITQFQHKLAEKGAKYNKIASENAAVGIRYFNGTFAGSEALIVVWYNTNTKIVYGAKAVFECFTKESGNNKYEELKSMLSVKYAEEMCLTSYKDDLEMYQIEVTDDESFTGEIKLFREKGAYPYDYKYFVQVEYLDAINYNKNQENKMKDL